MAWFSKKTQLVSCRGVRQDLAATLLPLSLEQDPGKSQTFLKKTPSSKRGQKGEPNLDRGKLEPALARGYAGLFSLTCFLFLIIAFFRRRRVVF